MEVLAWIESLPLSIWTRESDSLFAYSGILFLHTLGLGVVVGANVAVALSALARHGGAFTRGLDEFFPYMWMGFWINVSSGVLLVLADATTKLTNPVFYAKMGFVCLAVWNLVYLRRQLQAQSSPRGVRLSAALSCVLWTCAITAGRLMAYLGPVSGAPDLTN